MSEGANYKIVVKYEHDYTMGFLDEIYYVDKKPSRRELKKYVERSNSRKTSGVGYFLYRYNNKTSEYILEDGCN